MQPVDKALLFSRNDSSDPRLGELVRQSPGDEGVAILGYPDDEGISINGGRLGAKLGPTEIRRWLYRMTPHARRPLKAFWDLGDLMPDEPIAQRHEEARTLAGKALEEGHCLLGLGGGNDYAYSDGMAFLDNFAAETKPLVINVDAHLDVRDTAKGLSSGTPFRRLLDSGAEFGFVELGSQAQCNAQAHWEFVESKGGKILSLDEIQDSNLSLTEYFVRVMGDALLKPRPAYIAIDMDAFAWPYAIGTSAAWPLGLDPMQFNSLLQMLMKRLKVKALGIYEVSPPLDTGGGTARLAAQFAHGFLHHV